MLPRPAQHASVEDGFSLIELLVVMLLMAILLAIAIPAFLNQRAKAYDSSAKTQIQSAQTAMETYATDHRGAYPASVDTSSASDPLVAIEPSLRNRPYVTGTRTSNGYTLSAQSVGPGSAGDTFTLTFADGVITRHCSGPNSGCVGSSW